MLACSWELTTSWRLCRSFASCCCFLASSSWRASLVISSCRVCVAFSTAMIISSKAISFPASSCLPSSTSCRVLGISCTSPCTCSSKSPSFTWFVAIFPSRCIIACPALAARAFRKALSSLGFGDPCRLPEPESYILVPIPRRCPGGYGEPVLLGALSEWIGPSILEITEASVMRSSGSASSPPDISMGSSLVIRGKRDMGYVF